ncbi:MAG: hypothetical protein WBD36_15520 [Bacteroidota bacterium]
METISHLVRTELEGKPFLLEALSRRIVNHAGLAEDLKPVLQRQLRKPVTTSAVMMAIRRFASDLHPQTKRQSNAHGKAELIIKTGICDFNIRKSTSLLSKTKHLYQEINPEQGGFLNFIVGNNEVSISVSEQYAPRVVKLLKDEKILARERDLVALTIVFHDDFIHTPGVVYNVLRKIAWEQINIFEIISTLTELTLIIRKRDSMKAYEVLEEYAS